MSNTPDRKRRRLWRIAPQHAASRIRPGEPIEVQRRRYGYFPELFLYRGHRYRVYAVERCWTVSRWGCAGRIERHCFRVRCREGTFDLYQDVRHNTWHLERQVA